MQTLHMNLHSHAWMYAIHAYTFTDTKQKCIISCNFNKIIFFGKKNKKKKTLKTGNGYGNGSGNEQQKLLKTETNFTKTDNI